MDPMFGMTAVRDTRAMDLAIYKNKTQQMILEKQNTRLQSELKHIITKLDLELGDIRDFYRENSSSQRAVVCPRGLSCDQKQHFRRIRNIKQLSISLNEFDDRLDDYKRKMDLRRYGNPFLVPALYLDTAIIGDWTVPTASDGESTDDTPIERRTLLYQNKTFIPHEILYGSKMTFHREKTNTSQRPLLLDFHRLKLTY
ncbi:hypothetical protein LOTGIDRAFT_166407 [Lottia gigantea]|uniref:Uncharacterized protein n=1 Tax=Lottia gigantea TaxID=225164 RepID=V3ZY14_LOTGI|nr:hypothetical protein LOTGIDRAFT_166407 [Lottia gigantea]ESO87525.1 hypothetical protein LOTGIDRAFT_166407 [Lottia gigantea]